MSVYKDLEKRKLYQKILARERVLKKRTTEIIQKSVVESVVKIAEPKVEIAEQIVEMVEIAEPIVEIVERAEPIVEIIVASHFNCEECEFKMKRTEYNKNHTKCSDCFYPNSVRGKSLIVLEGDLE
jgi:hypothetical protein